MTFNPDDPKYTAYVLGELSDVDRAAVENEEKSESQVAALIDELRATTERLAIELRSEPLLSLAETHHQTLLAAANAPDVSHTIARQPSHRIGWAIAISASLLLAAGTGWLLRGATSTNVNRSVASNSMKQIDAEIPHTEWRDSATAASGAGPIEIVGVDPNGAATPSSEIEFRQGGINGPSAPLSGFDAATPQANVTDPSRFALMQKGRNQSSSNSINGLHFADRDDGYVGGQGVTNLALGTSSRSNAAGLGYGGSGMLVANHGADGKPLEVSGGTTAPLTVSNSTNVATNLATRPPIVKHLASEMISSSPSPSVNGANTYSGATTANTGRLMLGVNDALIENSGSNKQESHHHALSNGALTVNAADPNSTVAANNNLPLMARYANASSKAPEGINAALREDFLRSVSAERESNTESYNPLVDNQFLAVSDNPLSTFSIDVDTASYSNIRRFLMQQNQLPPAGAVRIEELINYFHYQYPQPEGERPFSVTTEVASCPWAAEHRLVRIGLKGREIAADKRPPTSLVFLIDVSGSMEEPNKLPLVQESLKLLTKQLTENDHAAIVVYAGNSGLVLPSTRGDKHEEIIAAIERLRAGGSTNGGRGIQLAYEIASQNFLKGGVNRVILATDGDFNVGITNQDELMRLIQEQAKTGVFLTTLGFGYGNLKDSTMQKLADKGNGNNYYIDDLPEARKVLVEQMGGTLVTIAKDVKIQIEFNPQEVAGYRLIGYEKRMLAKEDFNNDKIDAGEIGAGHTVTALYEVVPVEGRGAQVAGRSELGGPAAESGAKGEGGRGKAEDGDRKSADEFAAVDALKYVKPAELTEAAKTGELFTLKLRYKQPDGEKSSLMETPVKDAGKKYGEASGDFKFAAAVASFGMILRDSQFKGNATLAAVQEMAGEGLQKHDGGNNGADDAKENDERARRAEFIQIVERAKTLKGP